MQPVPATSLCYSIHDRLTTDKLHNISTPLALSGRELAKTIALATCLYRRIRGLGQSFASFVDSTCGISFCYASDRCIRDANPNCGGQSQKDERRDTYREQKATEVVRVPSTDCTLYCATHYPLFSLAYSEISTE